MRKGEREVRWSGCEGGPGGWLGCTNEPTEQASPKALGIRRDMHSELEWGPRGMPHDARSEASETPPSRSACASQQVHEHQERVCSVAGDLQTPPSSVMHRECMPPQVT